MTLSLKSLKVVCMARRDKRREVGIEVARAKLGDLVDRARLAGEVTILTRNGTPAAAIVPLSRLDEKGDS